MVNTLVVQLPNATLITNAIVDDKYSMAFSLRINILSLGFIALYAFSRSKEDADGILGLSSPI
jgi:hypothetical protein